MDEMTDYHRNDDQIERCGNCNAPLTLHPVYFACDEEMKSFCSDCWPSVKCEERHGEGCETVIFNSPMDAPKQVAS